MAVAMRGDEGEEEEVEPARAEATGECLAIKIFAREQLINFYDPLKKAWVCLPSV